jgi:signal transduction histidine kinase
MSPATVLFVDDETDVLHAFKRVFLEQEYRILTTDSGERALDLLAQDPVQMVVADYKMPGMDGAELVRRINELDPDTITILLSAHADAATVGRLIEEGLLYAYIVKPWNDDTLRLTVRRGLELRALRSENSRLRLQLEQRPDRPSTWTEPTERIVTGESDRDSRIDAILDLLMQIAAGNLNVHAPHSGRGDELDAIIESVNMLAEELRASDAELKVANERLVRSEKLVLLGQLCGGVAHELRNPLGALKNAAYFLNMALDSSDPEIKETLEIISKEVNTSERIIGNLLDFARPRASSQTKIDLSALMQEVLAGIAVPDKIKVVPLLDEQLPRMLADSGQLGQAFSNLIINAIQAMDDVERGRLVVQTEEELPGRVCVSISDSGVGIPADQLRTIFEPLFTTKAKGIGLGLAVARSMIDRHKGDIEVTSSPGEGTTFKVTLPTGLQNGTA